MAPLAVSVDEPPEQIVDGDAVAVTFGVEPTETVTETVFEHPLEFVPVTEYVVVEVGLTVILAVISPVLHWYEVAPLAVNVLDPPEQIVEGDAVAVTFGVEPTETVTETVLEQPLEFVPVTEYVVVELGLTVMLAVVSPVLH